MSDGNLQDLRDQAEQYIDEKWDSILDDLRELVSIPSTEDLESSSAGAPFGPGPRKALDAALGISERMGLAVHDCEGYAGYADFPGQSGKQIGIIGHVDVVPAGPGWSVEPYALTRRDGYVFGRGVLDDKGPLLMALHAVKFWHDRCKSDGSQLPYTIRVIFGANEETNMKDVEYYRAHESDPDFLFTPDSQFPVGYGESGICSGTLASPLFEDGNILDIQGGQAVNAVAGYAWATVKAQEDQLSNASQNHDRITVTSQGNGVFKIEAQGVSAHAMEPELGVNAIGLLADFLLESEIGTPDERMFLTLLQKLHRHTDGSCFGIACSDGHFGALSMVGGVIALQDGRITQSLDFRYPTAITAATIEQSLRRAIDDLYGKDTGEVAQFTMEHDKQPFLMDPTSPAVRALLDAYCEVTGEKANGLTSKGGTYARCFTTGVSFGIEKPWIQEPEWVGGMHGPDEAVREDQLKEAFVIYALAIGNLMHVIL